MNSEELETCTNIGTMYEADQFICSSCGIWLEAWWQVELEDNDEWHYEYIPKFCMNCGRKIIYS